MLDADESGLCWWGTNTYSDVKTLTPGTIETYTTSHYYIPTGSNVTTNPTGPSVVTSGSGQYGCLYNWCAAMGGQSTAGCDETTTPTPNPNISICPSGWRLPTGGYSGEFQALNAAVNGGLTNTDAGLRTAWLGQRSGRWSYGFTSQGSSGQYWTSTPASSQYYAVRFYFANNNVSHSDYWKNEGLAVRCVAN